MALFLITTSVSADEVYRFFYNFAPGSSFLVVEKSQQETGGKLISQFQSTVEFRVSQACDSSTSTITARINNLSNKGRRIDYYDEVTFQANISTKGEISGYSFSGGLPRHRQLIQLIGPTKRTDIFWMPRFPDRPMRVGDSFTHSVSIDGAQAERIYKLEQVEGHLARFRLREKGTLETGAVGGKEFSSGNAVFDLDKCMWSSLDLRSEGIVRLQNGLAVPYKRSINKEISDSPKTDPAVDPCQRLRFIIRQRYQEVNRLDERERFLDNMIETNEDIIRRIEGMSVEESNRNYLETVAPEDRESVIERLRHERRSTIEGYREGIQTMRNELRQISERRRQLNEEINRLREQFRARCGSY